MDSLEVNKAIAAVLVAGIVFMVAGLFGEALVRPVHLKESAIKIEGVAAPGAAEAKEEPLPPIGPLLAAANPTEGEAIAKRVCAVCHTFDQGGKALVGPNLYGVVGGPHAHMEGFSYSNALKSMPGSWDFDELNAWLRKPSAFAPGTRMTFAGISSDKQRADVIAKS
jgi:cytochrome c